jgi:hypothetical protein
MVAAFLRSASCVLSPSNPIRSALRLYDVLPVCSTLIGATSVRRAASRRSRGCCTLSIWKASFEVFLTSNRSTLKCFNRLKVLSFLSTSYKKLLVDQSAALNEFFHERETKPANDPSIKLFDEIILSKRNRGRNGIFSKYSTSFLTDTSDHLWRSAVAAPPVSRFPAPTGGNPNIPGGGSAEYRSITSRIPAKLDPALIKEPRVIQGVPRVRAQGIVGRRKPVQSMLGK